VVSRPTARVLTVLELLFQWWNEAVAISPILLPRAFFLLGFLKPTSGKLVREGHPLINRGIPKKSTASCQDLQ